jgi:hypothetical protein
MQEIHTHQKHFLTTIYKVTIPHFPLASYQREVSNQCESHASGLVHQSILHNKTLTFLSTNRRYVSRCTLNVRLLQRRHTINRSIVIPTAQMTMLGFVDFMHSLRQNGEETRLFSKSWRPQQKIAWRPGQRSPAGCLFQWNNFHVSALF